MKCLDCKKVFKTSNSLSSHFRHCEERKAKLREEYKHSYISHQKQPVQRSYDESYNHDYNNADGDGSSVSSDSCEKSSLEDDEEDEEVGSDNNTEIKEANEDQIPIEARFIPFEEVDKERRGIAFSYAAFQKTHGEKLYGKNAVNAPSWTKFKEEATLHYQSKGEMEYEKTLLWTSIAEFSIESGLSRKKGDKLLKLLQMCRTYGRVTIPKSYQTITNFVDKTISHYSYMERTIPFPAFWNMDKWKNNAVPSPVKIRCRDIMEMSAQMLMDPKLVFGWRKHLQFKAVKTYIPGRENLPIDQRERCYGDMMSSVWAEKTEEELLRRTTECKGRATLLPIILNSDGVALGATNQQANTVLAMFANCDDRLLRQDFSKFCLGYIPKLTISKEELVNHLCINAAQSKTSAERAYSDFERFIDKQFWQMVMEPVHKANECGIYMRILGHPKQVLLMYPYIVAHIGDEPGQKRMLGMFEGNAKYFCIHCSYKLENGIYHRERDIRRDALVVSDLCKLGTVAALKKFTKVKPTVNENKAYKLLRVMGIHPHSNPLHTAPMGYMNNIFMTPYDLLHTFCGGIMKTLMFSIVVIIDRLSMSDCKKYKQGKGIFDSRIVSFPTVPDCLPHVSQTVFKKGFMQVLSGKSSKEKGLASNSCGRLRSTHFVTLLFHAYFAIGDAGDVLPNEKNFQYKRTIKAGKDDMNDDEEDEMEYEGGGNKRKKMMDIKLGNVTTKVLTAIELVLSTYFQCKRAVHTERSILELRRSIEYLYVQLSLVWELQQALLGEKPTISKVRKPHFLMHFDEIISLFGAIAHFDTGGCEAAHKTNTTSVWDRTSKRHDSLNLEMLEYSILKTHMSRLSLVSKFMGGNKITLKNLGPPIIPDQLEFWRMQGSGSRHYQLLIALEDNSIKVEDPDSKKFIDLQDFVKHKTMFITKTFLFDKISQVLSEKEIGDIVEGDADLFLIQGMTYSANEDSGLGRGHIYATVRFNNTDQPRHDFVEVNMVDENAKPIMVLAQVLAFLEFRPNPKVSRYYAVLQYLMEECPPDGKLVNHQEDKLFKRYQWETAVLGKKSRTFSTDIVDFATINGPAWVVPDFASIGSSKYGGLRDGYQVSPKLLTDRYRYVPRIFTDRSGWEKEAVNELWVANNGEVENIGAWLFHNQTGNAGLQGLAAGGFEVDKNGFRDFDIGDIFENEGLDDYQEEQEDDDDEDNGEAPGENMDEDGDDNQW